MYSFVAISHATASWLFFVVCVVCIAFYYLTSLHVSPILELRTVAAVEYTKKGEMSMVLIPDCVRDILLVVESCDFGERLTLTSLEEKLPAYTYEELWYTCLKLEEGGYLELMTFPQLNSPLPAIKQIKDMTFFGHEFLNAIRLETTWDKTKEVAKRAGTFSLESLGEIAKGIAASAISTALQSLL